jgi:hypothetical protein
LFTAHSSLLDLVFYEGDQFPAEYKGSLFVARKGSWNRSIPTGYKVVRVPFKDGRPEGYYENFATGFWISGEQRAEVWGRPAGTRRRQGRRATRRRRHRRHDLAHFLQGPTRRARRRTGGTDEIGCEYPGERAVIGDARTRRTSWIEP